MSSVPIVQIQNVTLKNGPSNDPFAYSGSGVTMAKDDPHVDLAGIEYVGGVNYAQDAAVNSTSNLSMQVTLNLILKDVVSEGYTSWFANKNVQQAYRLKICQSTDPVITAAMLTKPLLKMSLNNEVFLQGLKVIDTIPLAAMTGIFSGKDTWTTTINDDGTVIQKVTYSVKIDGLVSNPKHLAYFLIPYFDMSAFGLGTGDLIASDLVSGMTTAIDYSGDTTQLQLDKELVGDILSEIIIDNHSVMKKSMLFYDADGVWPYHGPVHWMPPKSGKDGYWMSGAAHGETYGHAQQKLTAISVANTKVHDYRLINKINKIKLNFEAFQAGSILGSPKTSQVDYALGKTPHMTPSVKKDIYFTDMKLSRDSKGRCRFFFGINWRKILRDNSAFPNLYRFAMDEMLERFLDNSVLRFMKIKRRRVEKTYCENQLIDSCSDYKDFEDINEEVEVIAITGETATSIYSENIFNGSTFYKKVAAIASGNSGEAKATYEEMGSIHQVFLSMNLGHGSGTGIRHYTGIDLNMQGLTDGVYQYGIELNILDGLHVVLGHEEKKAKQAIEGLEEYLYEATKYNDSGQAQVDPVTNLFSEGIKQKSSKYGSAISKALSSFEDMLRLTSKKPNMEKMVEGLALLASPETGSPAGVEALISVMKTLRDQILKMLEYTATTKRYKNKSQGISYKSEMGGANQNNSHMRHIKIEHYFSNVFNADIDKNAGYDFLSAPGSPFEFEGAALSTNRLMTLTRSQYTARVKEEVRKFFSDSATADSESTLVDITTYSQGTTLDNSLYMYLTPSFVVLPNMEQPFGQLTRKETLNSLWCKWDPAAYAALVSDILNYNQGVSVLTDGEIPTNSALMSLTEEEQRLRRRLTSTLAAKNCTWVRRMTQDEAEYLQGIGMSDLQALASKISSDIEIENIFVDQDDGTEENLDLDSIKDPLAVNYDEEEELLVDRQNPIGLLLSLTNTKYLEAHDHRANSLKYYDIYGEDSISTLVDEIGEDPSKRTIADKLIYIPNHIKFLFLLHKGIHTKKIRTFWNTKHLGDDNFIQNQKYSPMMWMHIKNLVKVEILTSYGTGKAGTIKSMKDEKWYKLTKNLLTPGTHLCRISRYEEGWYDIKKPHPRTLELPIYNEYFMINVPLGSVAP